MQMQQIENGFKLEITKEVGEIKGHIDVLRVELSTQIKDLAKQTDKILTEYKNRADGCSVLQKHLEYHKTDEHKFGLWTLLKRKPLFAIIVGIIISSVYGFGLAELLALIKKLAL